LASEECRVSASARVGVSPKFHDLADTGESLRLARLAIADKAPDRQLWRSSMTRRWPSPPSRRRRPWRASAEGCWPPDDLPAEERAILVETFQAWLDAGGSANATAAAIYVHPNTMRHRLHRIEERTGKSLSRPRDIAELCLAFEVDRRLP
jgi:sugar diacid utilization regulator